MSSIASAPVAQFAGVMTGWMTSGCCGIDTTEDRHARAVHRDPFARGVPAFRPLTCSRSRAQCFIRGTAQFVEFTGRFTATRARVCSACPAHQNRDEILFGQPFERVGPLHAHLLAAEQSKSPKIASIALQTTGAAEERPPTGAVPGVATHERRARGALAPPLRHVRDRSTGSLMSGLHWQTADPSSRKIRIPSTTTTAVVMADPAAGFRKTKRGVGTGTAFQKERSEHAVGEASRHARPTAKSTSQAGNDGDGEWGASPQARSGRETPRTCRDQYVTASVRSVSFVLCVQRLCGRDEVGIALPSSATKRTFELTIHPTHRLSCGQVVAGRSRGRARRALFRF